MDILYINVILAGIIPYIYHDYKATKLEKDRIRKEKHADVFTLADGVVTT